MGLRRLLPALACVALTASLSGCFLEQDEEAGAARREGLDVRVGGIDYNVFITRELNPSLADDRTYWHGPEAKPGHALYGVFIQACNRSGDDDSLEDATYDATDDFTVEDTQGNTYKPLEPEKDNSFHYHPTPLEPGKCIPQTGSLAQLGPTGGAMIPFLFPLEAGENRPLELEIRSGSEVGRVELDL
jgi:hypothetical protein